MLITRCPNCETTFRVRMEQLNLRGGRVRCGHCHNPFSALASLEELPDDALPTPTEAATPHAAPSNPTPVSEPSPAASPQPALPHAEPAAPRPIAEPLVQQTIPHESTPAEDEPARHAAASTATALNTESSDDIGDFALEFDLGDTKAAAVPETRAAEAPPAPSESEPLEPENTFIELGSAEDDAMLEAEEFDRDVHGKAEVRSDFPIDDREDLDEGEEGNEGNERNAEIDEETVPQLHTVFLDDDIPPGAHIDPAITAANAKTRRTLILGNILLLLSGLVFAAYVLRVEITRYYPGLRAPLEQACSYLSCEVPYPRDADEVLLVGSDLTQATDVKGAYHLAVTVRNHARYPVAWPQMEITLTDRFERALTRRVLEPSEWLPPELAKRPAFEAQGELTSQITLSSDSQVMGYRLGVFYR